MTRCDECYQRMVELEREVASQKQIIDALVGVADKVIAERNAIEDQPIAGYAHAKTCHYRKHPPESEGWVPLIVKPEFVNDPATIRAMFEGDEE